MNVTQLAQEIAQARRSGIQTTPDWPDTVHSLADAMVVQEAVFAEFGSPSVGWKVGATNQAAQENFKIDGPFYGPMAESGVMESGGSLKKNDCMMACEPEFAFRMAKDFPANGEEINEASTIAAVDGLNIVIEVIGRCVSSADFANGVGLTMDFAGNSAFVVGPAVSDWQSHDLSKAAVISNVDGQETCRGTGELVMGNPINSLMWLAQALADAGKHLKAGDWVSTGTCTPPVPVKAGECYEAEFVNFGHVRVDFT